MEKINIAELLKDCPKGMELDCTMYDGVEFMEVDTESDTIILRVGNMFIRRLNKYGQEDNIDYAKCVIFPKGKTTWEGFVPPCKFKDGDIIFTHTNTSKGLLEYSWISIFKEYRNNRCACYVCLCLSDLKLDYDKWEDMLLCELCEIEESRLATEEEKRKLFDAIKDNGYRWNAETKTLEELVEPKFKVGDRIQSKDFIEERTIKICEEDGYWTTVDTWIRISDQDDWELVPNKFDIATLKPFDKVFVRDNNTQEWVISFFSHCNGLEIYKYSCINGHGYAQCVPYEENKHLLGTTNDCDDFYKTWEK